MPERIKREVHAGRFIKTRATRHPAVFHAPKHDAGARVRLTLAQPTGDFRQLRMIVRVTHGLRPSAREFSYALEPPTCDSRSLPELRDFLGSLPLPLAELVRRVLNARPGTDHHASAFHLAEAT